MGTASEITSERTPTIPIRPDASKGVASLTTKGRVTLLEEENADLKLEIRRLSICYQGAVTQLEKVVKVGDRLVGGFEYDHVDRAYVLFTACGRVFERYMQLVHNEPAWFWREIAPVPGLPAAIAREAANGASGGHHA